MVSYDREKGQRLLIRSIWAFGACTAAAIKRLTVASPTASFVYSGRSAD